MEFGLFYEIPEFLFYRRVHAMAFSLQSDDQSQLKAYNPEKVGRAVFREWLLLGEYCRSLTRVPLSWRERASVALLLLKRGMWNRGELVHELVSGGRVRKDVLRH